MRMDASTSCRGPSCGQSASSSAGLIERRDYAPSAKDWLSGATDMAFGVVILGLGFFMLLWVIATG
jgi:hypothetical protein